MSVRTVACPTCGAAVAWGPDSKFRPFCSERCKLIDLGAWAAEKYRVPASEPVDEAATEDPPGGPVPDEH
jgi:uncharacterized protein